MTPIYKTEIKSVGVEAPQNTYKRRKYAYEFE